VRSLEEARRENRRIIAALTSRIPAIEAPSEMQESAETVEDEGERGRAPARGSRCSGGCTAPPPGGVGCSKAENLEVLALAF
jgi:hypothetical protein